MAGFRKTAETVAAGAKTLPQHYFISHEIYDLDKAEHSLHRALISRVCIRPAKASRRLGIASTSARWANATNLRRFEVVRCAVLPSRLGFLFNS
jgi:hypothetical protein